MVKGVSRRVVVVKTPDTQLFEEAIFIVRADAFSEKGMTQEKVLSEAKKVANEYLKKTIGTKKEWRRLHPGIFAAGGAAIMAAIWFVVQML